MIDMPFANTNPTRGLDHSGISTKSFSTRIANCSGAGSAAPRSKKFFAVYDVYVSTYYIDIDILANQSTPRAT